MSLKVEVSERSKELGLYDFMVSLAKAFGPYDAVRLDVLHDGLWRFDVGYGVQIQTEKVLESYPVSVLEPRVEGLLVVTSSGQRFVLPEQVAGGYVRYQHVWKLDS